MGLPRFFERIFAAAGRHLTVSRESLEAILSDRVVALYCGEEFGSDANARWTAELSANLLARLYPRIGIFGAPDAQAHLRTIASNINPRVTFEETPRGTDVAVVIGCHEPAPPSAIHAGSSGWVCAVGPEPIPLRGPPNPFAAAAAGAIAAGQVFRAVFAARLAEPTEIKATQVSLLDFSSGAGVAAELGDLDVGPVAFAGLGAVGNAALWCLGRCASLRGQLALIDPEVIELSNLQRYVLTRDSDVRRAKIDLALEALRHTSLACAVHRLAIEDFAEQVPDASLPCIAISVDNVDGRRCAQALLPRLVVNGWTSDGGLGSSWHRFDQDAACLACLYNPKGIGKSQTELVADALGLTPSRAAELWVSHVSPSDAELATMAAHLGVTKNAIVSWKGRTLPELYSDVVCGSVQLDVKGLGRIESVPLAHQSVLAGVLMAAELVKRTDTRFSSTAQGDTLTVWDDVLRPPPRSWTQPRPREPGCICGDVVYQRAFRSKWGITPPPSTPSRPSKRSRKLRGA